MSARSLPRIFIDTNVFAYFFDQQDRRKNKLARSAVGGFLNSNQAVISYQVVQEFANVALRKFRPVLPPSEVQAFLDKILWPICEVLPDAGLYSEALSVVRETGLTFYDSLIIAAAAQAECKVLMTEDLQHGRKIRGVEIRSPFI